MKLKPLMPTLKERKRYLAYEIISEHSIRDFNDISAGFWDSIITNMGVIGTARAGVKILPDTFDKTSQKGLIRVSHTHVDDLRFALMNMSELEGMKVHVESIGVSGIIKKAKKKYLEG